MTKPSANRRKFLVLELDERNASHLAEHLISEREVMEMIQNRHISLRNPKSDERILVIGETHGGRVLTVSMEATRDPETWRPVTGWDSTDAESERFRRYCR